MLWKSLLTGTVLAGLAGAVVYFGSGGDFATAGVKADMRVAASETKAATASVTQKIGDVTSETMKIVADASNSLSASVKGGTVKSQMSKKADEPPTLDDSKAADQEPAEQEKTEKKWLDRYLNKKSNETKTNAPVDADTGVTDSLIDEKTSPQGLSSESEVKAVYETTLAETKAIQIVELRDRAYLSLIDYTVRNNDFARSKSVISEISQPELRDTARSNIAVGLARTGKRDAAFALLENIETKALSDILRLQVIEAMTTPLPNTAPDASRTN